MQQLIFDHAFGNLSLFQYQDTCFQQLVTTQQTKFATCNHSFCTPSISYGTCTHSYCTPKHIVQCMGTYILHTKAYRMVHANIHFHTKAYHVMSTNIHFHTITYHVARARIHVHTKAYCRDRVESRVYKA